MKTAKILVDINTRDHFVAIATMHKPEEGDNAVVYLDKGEVDPNKPDIVNTVEVTAGVIEGYIGKGVGRVAVILKENIALRLAGAISEKHNPQHSAKVAYDRLMGPSWIQKQAAVYGPAFKRFVDVWAKLDYQLVIVNARTLYRYQIKAADADLAELKSGDIIKLNGGISADGRFVVSENTFLNGEYPVRIVSNRNPQTGTLKQEYFVERMLSFTTEDGERKHVPATTVVSDFAREQGATAAPSVVAVINALKLRRENIAQLPSNTAHVAKITQVIDSSANAAE